MGRCSTYNYNRHQGLSEQNIRVHKITTPSCRLWNGVGSDMGWAESDINWAVAYGIIYNTAICWTTARSTTTYVYLMEIYLKLVYTNKMYISVTMHVYTAYTYSVWQYIENIATVATRAH